MSSEGGQRGEQGESREGTGKVQRARGGGEGGSEGVSKRGKGGGQEGFQRGVQRGDQRR